MWAEDMPTNVGELEKIINVHFDLSPGSGWLTFSKNKINFCGFGSLSTEIVCRNVQIDKNFSEYDIGYKNGLFVVSAKILGSDANSDVKNFSKRFFHAVKKAEQKVIEAVKNPKATPISTGVSAKNIGLSPNLVDDSGCEDGCDGEGDSGGGGSGGDPSGGSGGDPSGGGGGGEGYHIACLGPLLYVCLDPYLRW